MKLRQYVMALAATVAMVPALAADIDGKWNATADGGPAGPVELTFDLKADGEKLNGDMSMVMLPKPAPISEGTIKGDAVSFKIAIAVMEGTPPLVITYTGKLTGDELVMNGVLDMGQGPQQMPITAKRVK